MVALMVMIRALEDRMCYNKFVEIMDRNVAQKSSSKSEERVLKFRPRGSRFVHPLPQPAPVEDLSKYEARDAPDDYRHRMIMNLAALAATIFLIVTGIWIANTMAQMRKNQDCVLSGQRGCTPVEIPVESK